MRIPLFISRSYFCFGVVNWSCNLSQQMKKLDLFGKEPPGSTPCFDHPSEVALLRSADSTKSCVAHKILGSVLQIGPAEKSSQSESAKLSGQQVSNKNKIQRCATFVWCQTEIYWISTFGASSLSLVLQN